ncbi:MAG TPA: hypothetical protein GXX37_14275 [Clostridiaceae bacterium]|nr:hypothetical protein [Clostridiaceae bacterium]
MNLPNVWGQGSLFAYSGLDGINTYENSLVGTLCGDMLGVVFHTSTSIFLGFDLQNISDIEYELVASDIVKLHVLHRKTGRKLPLFFLFNTENTVIGMSPNCAVPYVYCTRTDEVKNKGKINIYAIDGEYIAFAKEEIDDMIKFALSYSKKSEEEATEKLKTSMEADVEHEVKNKVSFFEKLPRLVQKFEGDDRNLSTDENIMTDKNGSTGENVNTYENIENIDTDKNGNPSKNIKKALIEKTFYKCFSVMKSQVYSPEGIFKTMWTTPDRLPHKKLWLWDSVFHSFGNKYISKELAYDSIRAVLATQEEDGFIPHMAASTGERSDITQPPVLAWGVYCLYESFNDKNFLEETYSRLESYLKWNMQNRDKNKNWLFEWEIDKESIVCRCGESGMDNSPRFDEVEEMDCIDFSCFMANEARYMAKIAKRLGKVNEEKYWNEVYENIKRAVNDLLWDEEDKFYYDRILSNGNFKKVKSVASFLPLFAGICDKYRADCLYRHLTDKNSFDTELPIPSISKDDPTFGTDMWRGPVWINYNYMIIQGLKEYGYIELAQSILKKTIEAIAYWYEKDGCIYEFYDSENRVSPSKLNRKGIPLEPYNFRIRPQAIRDYGWSASLYVAMVLDNGW